MSKVDWDAALQVLFETERQLFGAPPTEEKLLAFAQNELPAEEAFRVQKYIALHPELARSIVEPVPESYQGEPGAHDFLSRDALQHDWAALQARISGQVEEVVVHLDRGVLETLRRTAERSGRSVADLVREAVRQVWHRPEARGPVALWEGKPKRTSLEHDSIYDEL